VTAYVDGELRPSLEQAVERHLAACPSCAAQARFEIELASRLRLLPEPRLPNGFCRSVLEAALGQPPPATHAAH
jgi:anti-sigma factor RsiW